MASKGAITISHDELIRMKMRANVIPNRISPYNSRSIKQPRHTSTSIKSKTY